MKLPPTYCYDSFLFWYTNTFIFIEYLHYVKMGIVNISKGDVRSFPCRNCTMPKSPHNTCYYDFFTGKHMLYVGVVITP